MTSATIDKMIANYQRQADERGKALLADHMAWRARQKTMFPSTLPDSRGAVSPSDGRAKPAGETQAPKALAPKSDRWW
jgi:hypothetical protein